jgi:hypothetical protein
MVNAGRTTLPWSLMKRINLLHKITEIMRSRQGEVKEVEPSAVIDEFYNSRDLLSLGP